MPNANYLAGRRFEYEAKALWEARGYTVLRTAGSHGSYDLVAFRPNRAVEFIQCKVAASQKVVDRLATKFREVSKPSSNYQQSMIFKIKGSKTTYEYYI